MSGPLRDEVLEPSRGGWALGAPRRKKGQPRQPPVDSSTDSSTVQAPTRDSELQLKKRHACLVFGFVGTDFHGLQCADRALGAAAEAEESQPTTVADVLRSALLQSGAIAESNLWPLVRTKWTLASRTDKGVHAAAAAVSFRMETLAEQIEQCGAFRMESLVEQIEQCGGDSNDRVGRGGGGGDRAGGEGGDEDEGEGEGGRGEGGRGGAAGDCDEGPGAALIERAWLLSDAEVARINRLLPPAVRLFGGGHVRKGFRARECASARDYEHAPAAPTPAAPPECRTPPECGARTPLRSGCASDQTKPLAPNKTEAAACLSAPMRSQVLAARGGARRHVRRRLRRAAAGA